MIQFAYTILYVSSVEKSIEFYEKAFGFSRKFITPECDYAELMSGETTLAFASKDLANSNLKNGFLESNVNQKPFGIELGFVVNNVEDSMNIAIEAGAKLIENATQKPWGQSVGYVSDIDGFLIEICTKIN